MSISRAVTPSASISFHALPLVWSLTWRSRASCRRGCSRAAGRARSIARATHDQRVRGVQAAGDADHDLLDRRSRAAASRARGPGCCRPRSSARCGVAGSAGTYGKRSMLAPQRRRGLARPERRTGRGGTRSSRSRWSCDRVAERVRARAVGEHPVEVDVGEQQLLVVGEALGLGDQVAVLVDHRLAVPGEVGRRLARGPPPCRCRRRSQRADCAAARACGGSRPCRP